MLGKRIADGAWPENPGEYSKHRVQDQGIAWFVYPPIPDFGPASIAKHTVIEHGDGTITVSPSILITGVKQWHGYLEHGVWREC